MKFPRRKFLHLAVVAAALPALSRQGAWAQTYPARPVHIVVGFAAGGGQDILARLVARALSERLGQSFIVDNKPGAGTNIATELVVNAPPDGYTLLLVGPPAAINATLDDNLKFNFIRDIAPVASIVRVPFVMVVNPSFPAQTVPAFIAYAKANPRKLSMASGGIGSGPHLAGELFKATAGVDMVTVHYRGDAPSLTDLMGGQVQVYFSSLPPAIELIRAGKLRALAVTSARRSDVLPDVPTVAEFVPGYEASAFFGLGAPRKTPMEIVERLNKEIGALLGDSNMKERLADLGGVPLSMTASEFDRFIVGETQKWGNVIRLANIKAE